VDIGAWLGVLDETVRERLSAVQWSVGPGATIPSPPEIKIAPNGSTRLRMWCDCVPGASGWEHSARSQHKDRSRVPDLEGCMLEWFCQDVDRDRTSLLPLLRSVTYIPADGPVMGMLGGRACSWRSHGPRVIPHVHGQDKKRSGYESRVVVRRNYGRWTAATSDEVGYIVTISNCYWIW